MTELLIDPNIRVWVFLPIVVITFLVGIIRHYVSMLISSQKKVELTQIQDSQAMIRARLLRENGKYLTAQSFAMRRHYFNNDETGYFKTQKRPPVSPKFNSNAIRFGQRKFHKCFANGCHWRLDQLDVFWFCDYKSTVSVNFTL